MTDAHDIVERFWPYDGPHSSDTVTSAAQVIAGLVRYMNNATWDPQRLNGPALYGVLSSLNSAVYGLDQLLAQLVEATSALTADPTLYDDRRDQPAAITAGLIAGTLHTVRESFAGEARRQLERAAQLASHLGHDVARPTRPDSS